MSDPRYLVAIIGGAVSGAEAANQLAEHGIHSVVIEQNALPYGKIEDGLPKWHVKLRNKEQGRIDSKLSSPYVQYVPKTTLGRDVDFEDLAKNWGFNAVILATGAWKDRPLPIDSIDAFENKGLIYQNSFIYWYNHKHEPAYTGPQYKIEDGACIIGGGLASLDVAKVLMFETVESALKERGHDVNVFKLDRSIAKVLDQLGVSLEDLGVQGCTLYYRRRVNDMPLTPMDTDTPEKLAKAEKVREKVLNNYKSKYLFQFKPLHVPVDKIIEDGRVTGLVFQKTQIVEGRAKAIPGTEFEVKAPYFISSIGSIPENIPGIPSRGQVYDVEDGSCCKIAGYQNVFAIGNAVTGRGNINESLKHGRETTKSIIENYFPQDEDDETYASGFRAEESTIQKEVQSIGEAVKKNEQLSDAEFNGLLERVKALQSTVGYDGDYAAWVSQHLPERLEDMLGIDH